jgi:two-component system sensor histidine kinase UhpB
VGFTQFAPIVHIAQAVRERGQVQRQLDRLREQARARIARNLHDRLGGTLTGPKLVLSRTRKDLSSDVAEAQLRLAALPTAVDHTIAIVRQIATKLRRAILRDLGF